VADRVTTRYAPLMSRACAVLLAVTAAALAGCPTSGPEDCTNDRDCGGDVCTRVGACVAAADVYALRIEWTVRGLTTDQATACDGVGELELSIAEPATGEVRTVRPVPCISGSFRYDKLPLSYTEVTLTAYDAGGGFLDSQRASALGTGGVVRIALLR